MTIILTERKCPNLPYNSYTNRETKNQQNNEAKTLTNISYTYRFNKEYVNLNLLYNISGSPSNHGKMYISKENLDQCSHFLIQLLFFNGLENVPQPPKEALII